MKKILLIAILLLSNLIAAQSRTEKYNSIMERYEYFDNNGNMLGYKKYNSLMRQWEYFDTSKNISSKNTQDYIDPYNTDLINTALSNKQNKYENNTSKINSKIKQINQFFQLLYDYKDIPEINKQLNTINSLHQTFIDGINNINNSGYDFSSNATTNEVLIYLEQFETRLISISRQIRQ